MVALELLLGLGSFVSGIASAKRSNATPAKMVRARKAASNPDRWTRPPATTVLKDAPMPVAAAIKPCVKLKCPVPHDENAHDAEDRGADAVQKLNHDDKKRRWIQREQ